MREDKKIKPTLKLTKDDIKRLKKELPKKMEIGKDTLTKAAGKNSSFVNENQKKDSALSRKRDQSIEVLGIQQSTNSDVMNNDANQNTDGMVETLDNGATQIELPLNGENIIAFKTYAEMLKERNKVMNLTNIVDNDGIAMRHFIDSLTLISFLNKEFGDDVFTLIDVGTGAGFPGIPLKIVNSKIKLTLLDSLNKRINFLNDVVNELKLEDVVTLHKRAEDAGKDKLYREKYDVATARAVASLRVLAEYCMPFVKVGGMFIAMKSHVDEELEEAKRAIKILGGKIEKVEEFNLPGTDMKRTVVIIRKEKATPNTYPRQAGKPGKEPL